jgi:hypothetical protein
MLVLASRAVAAPGAPVAPAAPPPAGLEGTVWLDARAPVFAAIHPTDLGDGFALMDLLGGIFPETMRTLNRVRDGLGLYSFSAGEFSESGVDPDAIVVASWGVADEADWAARKQDKQSKDGKKSGARPVFVRHRFVIKTLDGDRLVRAAVAILAGSNISVANFARARGEPSIPDWASAADVKALVKKHGILVLGRARDGALISMRRVGGLAIVDYADPWAGVAADAKGEVASALAKMVATPKETLATALAKGTRRLLSTEDVSIALVVEPAALGALLPRASCRKDWMTPESALFDDAAVLLRLHPFQWRLEIAWGLTALGKARLGGVANDDGLVDPRAATSEGIAAGGLMVDSFDAIRTAPRPAVLAGKAEQAAASLEACGPISWLTVGARFWPQLAALQLERLTASLTPGAPNASASILPSLRNVAAVLRHLPDAKETWENGTVLLGSLPPTAEPAVTEALASLRGSPPDVLRSLGGHGVLGGGARAHRRQPPRARADAAGHGARVVLPPPAAAREVRAAIEHRLPPPQPRPPPRHVGRGI